MFIYPAKAEYNRTIPKVKIYTKAKPSKSVKARFVLQVGEIIWKYKLSPETTNLAARDGFAEIQVFEIILRQPELDNTVMMAIDRAIPYPIFYRLLYEGQAKRVAAYKRPAADSPGKWVTETYFETDWSKDIAPAMPLPVALDIKALYEQILFAYIDLPRREGENLDVLVERAETIRKYRRNLRTLEAKMKSEKQFNRKVELNAQVRVLNARLTKLTSA